MKEEEIKAKKTSKRPQVNERCIGCWACMAICPDAFDLTDEWYAKAVRLDNYEGIWVEDAINACPVDAIKWIEI
ncbi:MAG: hypothetical protein ACD_3C00010G0003 [uncultured bacterium (gcode 4)]|uniref:Ferredoxin n=1 Tax=uncultured bacterium (gcode 4) TaxID=1234023 RepID=K2GEV3_9BACT|nr:MAG: hypothetical protein ACD_3C00010G0003 [uncultured bacterium (gcode 4)]